MRLITRYELATKTNNELHALLRECFNIVASSKQNSPECYQAIATMQNVQIEFLSRIANP